jgi:protoporphyrinogen/coproporphyrinogen III oxidase
MNPNMPHASHLTPHASRITPHVAIIGGGITGLATAWYLGQLAPEVAVTLLEASGRAGGKVITHFVDGQGDQPFVLEAGADAFLARQKPWAYELALELGLSDRLLPTNDARSGVYVVQQGKLLRLPPGLQLIVPTDWEAFERSPLLSTEGKARMAEERDIPPRLEDGDESVAAFVTRRLGAEALARLGEPLLSGIYSARPEEQSILATFPRFRQMERRHGSLLRAVEATRNMGSPASPSTAGGPQPSSTFVSFRNGTQELPDALADRVKANIRLNSGVQSIEEHEGRYRLHLADGENIEADRLVLAIPAAAAAALLRPLAETAATTLDTLRTVSSGVIYLAYPNDQIAHPMDGFGAVTPIAEGRNFNALTWVTSKFQGRAPREHSLIRLFFGGARSPHMMELDDAEIEGAARQELHDLMGLDATPRFHRVFRWWHAQPQYDVGHLERMAKIERSLPPNIHLAGTAYHGVGIPDCVQQARRVAEAMRRRGDEATRRRAV